MKLGRIFKSVTGRDPSEFQSPAEVFGQVQKVRGARKFNEIRYGNDLVKCRGGIFRLGEYNEDIDQAISSL
jgi:hypothetical protein